MLNPLPHRDSEGGAAGAVELETISGLSWMTDYCYDLVQIFDLPVDMHDGAFLDEGILTDGAIRATLSLN